MGIIGLGGGATSLDRKSAGGYSLEATGGSISEANGYKIHVFNSSGSFVVSDGSADIEFLVIAGGGGGGGYGGGLYGSGGGAGGYRSSIAGEPSGGGGSTESAVPVTPSGGPTSNGTYPITIGAGGGGGYDGSPNAAHGTKGGTSKIF